VTRTTRLANELPVAAVVAVGTVGFLVAAVQHHWRRGLYLVAAALLLGAVLRLVLPARRVGSLAVRSKAVDVATLVVLGAGVALLAGAVPA
jgi:hypothetical protein